MDKTIQECVHITWMPHMHRHFLCLVDHEIVVKKV